MSDALTRRPSCERTPAKKKFLSSSDAEHAVLRWECARREPRGGRLRSPALYPYECTSCGYWHLSRSQPNPNPDARR